MTALVASGLPTGRYAFEGFLPRKGSGRSARLTELAGERRTVVLYEAPHRLVRTLTDLAGACGDGRRVALGRELTKLHEEVWRGTLAEALAHLEDHPPRGELVIVLDGAPTPEAATAADVDAAVAERLAAGDSARDAAATVAAALGVPKRTAYDAALRQRP